MKKCVLIFLFYPVNVVFGAENYEKTKKSIPMSLPNMRGMGQVQRAVSKKPLDPKVVFAFLNSIECSPENNELDDVLIAQSRIEGGFFLDEIDPTCETKNIRVSISRSPIKLPENKKPVGLASLGVCCFEQARNLQKKSVAKMIAEATQTKME